MSKTTKWYPAIFLLLALCGPTSKTCLGSGTSVSPTHRQYNAIRGDNFYDLPGYFWLHDDILALKGHR